MAACASELDIEKITWGHLSHVLLHTGMPPVHELWLHAWDLAPRAQILQLTGGYNLNSL